MAFADRDRLESLLACPACGSGLARRGAARELACASCGARVHELDRAYVFPSPELPAGFEDPEYTSCNPYTWDALELIEACADGVVVDLGAGEPRRDFPNVVQVELRRYRGTDVVFAEGRLPFADGCVDGVVSLSVLEHVRDPARFVSEVRRVLRPGGRCVAHAAFLQPLHGAPSHYFNMTRQGLRELFAGFELEQLRCGPHQHPWLMLHWVLGAYLRGLGEADRAELGALRVDELMQRLEAASAGRVAIKQHEDPAEISRRLFAYNEEHAEQLGALGRLAEEAVEELAAGFSLTARKPR